MAYKITLRSNNSYKTFIISLTAHCMSAAKNEAQAIYADCSVIKVENGHCINW